MLQPNLTNLTPNALLIAAIRNTAIERERLTDADRQLYELNGRMNNYALDENVSKFVVAGPSSGCPTPGLVSTGMSDCLGTGELSRYITSNQYQLSLPSLRGKQIEYRLVWLGIRRSTFTCVRWHHMAGDASWLSYGFPIKSYK